MPRWRLRHGNHLEQEAAASSRQISDGADQAGRLADHVDHRWHQAGAQARGLFRAGVLRRSGEERGTGNQALHHQESAECRHRAPALETRADAQGRRRGGQGAAAGRSARARQAHQVAVPFPRCRYGRHLRIAGVGVVFARHGRQADRGEAQTRSSSSSIRAGKRSSDPRATIGSAAR
jgi:hypothetical protein